MNLLALPYGHLNKPPCSPTETEIRIFITTMATSINNPPHLRNRNQYFYDYYASSWHTKDRNYQLSTTSSTNQNITCYRNQEFNVVAYYLTLTLTGRAMLHRPCLSNHAMERLRLSNIRHKRNSQLPSPPHSPLIPFPTGSVKIYLFSFSRWRFLSAVECEL